jgi:DNA-binding transcriptional MerR regulator/predicted transcriptional regulator YdeE
MYTIGEFSKINMITTKTLRHYDHIGLLKPEKIDDWTGYRHYSSSQLPEIQLILRLRDVGFGLTEIGEILHNFDNAAMLLRRRQREIAQIIKEEQRRLSRVESFLVEVEGDVEMKSEIIIKSLPEVIVASMRTVVPSYDTYFDIVPKMGEYMNSVGAVCLEPAYCFTIYHDGEYQESDIDVEICEAVVETRQESDKVKFKTISGVSEAACVFHKGPYSTLRETYNKLFQWVEAKGYHVADNPRESYIDGIWNKDDQEEWLTEVQVPVTRKG